MWADRQPMRNQSRSPFRRPDEWHRLSVLLNNPRQPRMKCLPTKRRRLMLKQTILRAAIRKMPIRRRVSPYRLTSKTPNHLRHKTRSKVRIGLGMSLCLLHQANGEGCQRARGDAIARTRRITADGVENHALPLALIRSGGNHIVDAYL